MLKQLLHLMIIVLLKRYLILDFVIWVTLITDSKKRSEMIEDKANEGTENVWQTPHY